MEKQAFGNDECFRCGQHHPMGQECDQPPRRALSDGTQMSRVPKSAEIEVTPAMIKEGLAVFYASGVVDAQSAEDSCIVAEIFLAMAHQECQGAGQTLDIHQNEKQDREEKAPSQ